MIKIAHISDLHLDTEKRPNCIDEIEFLLEKILETGHDHIAITGDVVDVANYDDLFRLREVFVRLGILNWEKVTLIPGNHDIFGKYEVIPEGFAATIKTTATRAMESKGLGYAKKLHEFCNIFRETITEDLEIKEYFPFVKILSNADLKVSLISFNSVLEWSLNINPTGARGYVHASERFGIRHPEIIKTISQTFPIALFHHAYFLFEPKTAAEKAFIWSMELIEREAFLETLKIIGVKIALHGHYHRQEKYTIDNILFLNSGSVKRSASSINSITIHPDFSVTQTFHRLHDE